MSRIAKVKKILSKHHLDAILISEVSNIVYLTGYEAFSKTEREGFALITKNKQYIVSSPLHTEDVVKQTKGFDVVDRTSWETLGKKFPIVGFEAQNLTVSEYTNLKKHFSKLTPIDLAQLRLEKSEEEIKHLKKACKIAESAFEKVLKSIKAGVTEKEIAFKLETYMQEQGAEVAFSSVVAFSKNSSVAHHSPDNSKLAKNQMILFDFGASVHGYCSDVSRTIFFGKANNKFRKMYQTCLIAQQKAIDELSRTNSAMNVDEVARDYILKQGYASMPHALGHGVGLEVHELPHLSPRSDDKLTEGMVFSLEPGIYLPGFGGVRIEDLVYLSKGKVKLLTHPPKHLIEL